MPVTHEGVLRVKITVLDGKVRINFLENGSNTIGNLCNLIFQRSSDRSWRTVQAENKGNRLKLTLIREGKVSQVSYEFNVILRFWDL